METCFEYRSMPLCLLRCSTSNATTNVHFRAVRIRPVPSRETLESHQDQTTFLLFYLLLVRDYGMHWRNKLEPLAADKPNLSRPTIKIFG